MKTIIKKSFLSSILILLFQIIGSCQNTLYGDINKFLSSYTNQQYDSLIIFQSSTLKDISVVQANNKYDSLNGQQSATIYVIQKFSNQFKIIDSTPSFITQGVNPVILNSISKDTLNIEVTSMYESNNYIYIFSKTSNKYMLSSITGNLNTYEYSHDNSHRIFEYWKYNYNVKDKKLKWDIYRKDKLFKSKVKIFTAIPQGIYPQLSRFQVTTDWDNTPSDILFSDNQ